MKKQCKKNMYGPYEPFYHMIWGIIHVWLCFGMRVTYIANPTENGLWTMNYPLT